MVRPQAFVCPFSHFQRIDFRSARFFKRPAWTWVGFLAVISSFGCNEAGPTGPTDCTITLPGGATLPQVAHSGASDNAAPTIQVQTGATCSWTVSSPANWFNPSPPSGTGSGTVRVTVERNTTPYARTGTLTVGGQVVTVSQAAGQIPDLDPIFGEIPECNYQTLTPNYAAEWAVLSVPRFREWMNNQPIKTWIDNQLDSNGIGAAVRSGLESWDVAAGGRLGRLEYTSDRTASTLDVFFSNSVPSDAIAFFEYVQAGSSIAVGNIMFSTDFFSYCRRGSDCRRMAQTVAAHEMGHALAVRGHAARTDSIMQNVSSDRLPTAPTQTDVNTVRTAYGCR